MEVTVLKNDTEVRCHVNVDIYIVKGKNGNSQVLLKAYLISYVVE